MTLTVEAALARDQAELEMLEAEIAERRQRIDALKVRVSVLMDVLNAGGPPQAARPADDDADWLRMPRTQAVERMLAQRAPISPQALAQALNDVGRAEDNWERVGRVLDYLRKHSRAKT